MTSDPLVHLFPIPGQRYITLRIPQCWCTNTSYQKENVLSHRLAQKLTNLKSWHRLNKTTNTCDCIYAWESEEETTLKKIRLRKLLLWLQDIVKGHFQCAAYYVQCGLLIVKCTSLLPLQKMSTACTNSSEPLSLSKYQIIYSAQAWYYSQQSTKECNIIYSVACNLGCLQTTNLLHCAGHFTLSGLSVLTASAANYTRTHFFLFIY